MSTWFGRLWNCQSCTPGQSNLPRTVSFLSLIGLLILPKCSLCLFTIGTLITVCGMKNIESISSWQYALVLLLTLIPMWIIRTPLGTVRKAIILILVMSATALICVYLFYSKNEFIYYSGLIPILFALLISTLPHSKNLFAKKIK